MIFYMVNLFYRLIDFLTPALLLYGVHLVLLAQLWNEAYTLLALMSSLLLLATTQLMGGYKKYVQRTVARKLEIVIKGWAFVVLACLAIVYLWGGSDLISRKVFVVWALVTPFVLILLKIGLNRYCLASSQIRHNVVILGEGYPFTEFEQNRLNEQKIAWTHFEGFDPERLNELVCSKSVQVIVLNIKKKAPNELIQALTRLEFNGVKLISMNHFFEEYLRKCYIPYDVVGVDYLDDVQKYTRTQFFYKRMLDYFASFSLFFLMAPVMIYAVRKIKKESPGRVFFKQSRVGENGVEFEVIKFRSMHENSHFDPYTKQEDPRVFTFGQFMRKTRIDELPQLWNVLRGDMHLLGPRTEWDILVSEYEKEIPFYHERHLVRPGISGWAQVMYPYGANVEDARQKLMYDLYYIKRWSIWLEMEAVIRTVGVILGKKGV